MVVVDPTVSVAVTSKLNVPVAVGVPLITPVAPVNVNPVGKAPDVTANVAAPVPFVLLTVWL